MAESPMTEPQLFGALQNAHTAGDTDGAQRIAQIIQTQRLTAQSRDQKYEPSGKAFTAINEFGNAATFGGAKYLSALVRSYAHNKPYNEALSEIQGENESDYQANPKTSWGGFAAGLVTGAGALKLAGEGLKATGAVADAINPFVFEKGARVANIAKMGVVGGGISAAEAAAEGKDPAEAAIVGGVLSAVAGGAGAKLAQALEPASYKVAAMLEGVKERFSGSAWKLIGKVLGEDVGTLAQAAAAFKANAGRDATLTDLIQFKQQGKLRDLAERAPVVANALREQQIAESLQSPQTLRQTVERVNGGAPATEEGLALERRSNMDTRMNAIRDNPVEVTGDELTGMLDQRILRSMGRGVAENDTAAGGGIRTRLDAAMRDAETNGRTRMSVGDIDALRKEARNLQGSLSKDHPLLADEFADLAERISTVGSRSPGYGEALSEYAAASRKLEGFKVGASLGSREDVGKTYLSDRLRSQEGTEGYRSGLLSAIHKAAGEGEAGALGIAKKITTNVNLQRSLSEVLSRDEAQQLGAHSQHILSSAERLAAVTPRSVRGEQGPGATELAHGIGAAGSALVHSPTSSVYHAGRFLARLQLPISEGVQKKVVQYLSDPKMVKQGISILKRAGATQEQIQGVMRSAGAQQIAPQLGVSTASQNE